MAPPALDLGLARVPRSLVEEQRQLRRLCDEERATLFARASEKRRREHMAGRVAARRALERRARRGGVGVDELYVGVVEGGAEAGRPLLCAKGGVALPEWHVSITHDSGLALAAVAGARVGIDLVTVEDRGAAFRAEAFVGGEVEGWRAVTSSWGAAESLAFAAKEAVLKLCGHGLREPLLSFAVRPAADGAVVVEGGPLAGGGLFAMWRVTTSRALVVVVDARATSR